MGTGKEGVEKFTPTSGWRPPRPRKLLFAGLSLKAFREDVRQLMQIHFVN